MPLCFLLVPASFSCPQSPSTPSCPSFPISDSAGSTGPNLCSLFLNRHIFHVTVPQFVLYPCEVKLPTVDRIRAGPGIHRGMTRARGRGEGPADLFSKQAGDPQILGAQGLCGWNPGDQSVQHLSLLKHLDSFCIRERQTLTPITCLTWASSLCWVSDTSSTECPMSSKL